jgi:hypothetical protein
MSPTPHRYQNPAWELGDVFGWVLDRDPEKFGRIFSLHDWQSALYRVHISSAAAVDPPARTVLLHALQRGVLVARDRDGNRIDPDYWLSKTEADLPALSRAFLFRREEVLKVWPAEPAPASPEEQRAPVRTGLAGRPTSWHLIEPECRRRYANGERYPTRKKWALVLIDWLIQCHPAAARPEGKTLTNKLPGLLRELGGNSPEIK